MSLAIGARLGPYEISSHLGCGGMGVLPSAFANEPGRMARFEREAQVLAALNHTNTFHFKTESSLEIAEIGSWRQSVAGLFRSSYSSGRCSDYRTGIG